MIKKMKTTTEQKSFTSQLEEQIEKLRDEHEQQTKIIDTYINKDFSKVNIRFLEVEKELNNNIIIRLSQERSCISAKINALQYARDLYTFIETNKNTEDESWYINNLHDIMRKGA